MYICIKCGAVKEPGIEKCRCGSTVFIKGNGTINKKKDRPIDFSKSVENVRIARKGVFMVDLEALTKSENLIIKDEQGIYYIHLPVKIPNIVNIEKQIEKE